MVLVGINLNLSKYSSRNFKMITRNLKAVLKKILSSASSYVGYHNMVCLGEPHGTKRNAKKTAWMDIKLLDQIDLN